MKPNFPVSLAFIKWGNSYLTGCFFFWRGYNTVTAITSIKGAAWASHAADDGQPALAQPQPRRHLLPRALLNTLRGVDLLLSKALLLPLQPLQCRQRHPLPEAAAHQLQEIAIKATPVVIQWVVTFHLPPQKIERNLAYAGKHTGPLEMQINVKKMQKKIQNLA